MTYLRRSNPAARRGKRVTLLWALAVALVFAVHFMFPGFYPATVFPVAAFVWKPFSATFSFIFSLDDMARSKYGLIKQAEALRAEIAGQASSMLMLDTLRSENEELKALLGRSEARGGGQADLLAVVLQRPPVSPYDTLVLDVGENDGVQVGDRVYASGDVLVGEVVEAYARESKASLFSSPGHSTPVLLGPANIAAQAMGRGGGNFAARVPAEVGVEVGDTIVSQQLRSHTFGVIERIDVDSADSIQTVLFKAPVNINELRFVTVDTR